MKGETNKYMCYVRIVKLINRIAQEYWKRHTRSVENQERNN
jgi:hypothetical protein